MKTFKFILDALKPYTFHIVCLILIEVFWAIDLSLRPYLLKIMIDRLEQAPLRTDVYALILVPASGFLALSLITLYIFRISDLIYLKMAPVFRNELILKSLERIQCHSYSYFQSHFGGSIATRIAEMVDAAQNLISLTIYRFFAHTLAFIIACFTISAAVHPHFLIILVSCAILFISASYFLSKKPYKLAETYLETYAILIGKLIDSISNTLPVILFGRRKYEHSYLLSQAKVEIQASQNLQWVILLHQAIASLFLIALISSILIYLIYLYQSGRATIGDFVLTLTITVSVADNLQDTLRDILKFSENLGKCALALELINKPPSITDIPGAPSLEIKQGKIEFQNVCFGYHSDQLLFDHLSVSLEPHQKVGLVGYSGSGKTTFVNLILRLFPLQSGRILIDEQDISKVKQDSLHEQISYIPQDAILFNRSVFENISYGKTDATEEDIIEAAKKAHAHAFIMELPKGYHTVVGERGMMLSGGQRQRIAIARAILKNSKILILDEASSVLDPVTECYLQESLNQVMKNKTVVAIAHRLPTLLAMDRILVFNKGQIIEDGPHQKLLDKGGIYSQLWKSQNIDFLFEKERDKKKEPLKFSCPI